MQLMGKDTDPMSNLTSELLDDVLESTSVLADHSGVVEREATVFVSLRVSVVVLQVLDWSAQRKFYYSRQKCVLTSN